MTSNSNLVFSAVTTYYSGGPKHERGVGIILGLEISRAVIAREPVNDQIIIIM